MHGPLPPEQVEYLQQMEQYQRFAVERLLQYSRVLEPHQKVDAHRHWYARLGDLDGPPLILRNDGGNRNNWITLELIGSRGNRLALGARVKVVAGKLSQVDEVRSGGSYLSQNDLRLHFGLGKAERVDRVEIRWPSGKTETLTNLAARSFYTVKEGAGIVPSLGRRRQN